MTEHQRLFLVQARSAYEVFELLRKNPDVPHCHALHYLQMATEMLGKAHAWRDGPHARTHRAFVSFLRSLTTNRSVQKRLGFQGKNQNWQQSIRKHVQLAEGVEDLAPALAGDGPNPEYPWPRDAPDTAPADHKFQIWEDLQETTAGRQFLSLVHNIFNIAHEFL